MKPFALIDLHCDTLTMGPPPSAGAPDPLDDPRRALSLSALPPDVHWAQCFAIFIPDKIRGQDAVAFFARHRAVFARQTAKFSDRVSPCRAAEDMEDAWAAGKTAAFLTVENGSVLAGDPGRVPLLARQGVCAVTLVWNGENELGSGRETGRGLTAAGKAAVREMERCGILVDVSHLNDRGFYDLLDVAQKPFLATHSNARAICAHKRNLTDDMVREMVRRDCLIGLNYYVRFLREDGNVSGLDDLCRHATHLLALGAENQLALGSDFDGAELPDCLSRPAKVLDFYDCLLSRGVPQAVADGIFFENARRFFRRNLQSG